MGGPLGWPDGKILTYRSINLFLTLSENHIKFSEGGVRLTLPGGKFSPPGPGAPRGAPGAPGPPGPPGTPRGGPFWAPYYIILYYYGGSRGDTPLGGLLGPPGAPRGGQKVHIFLGI